MTRLIDHVGWPMLIVAALLFVTAVPTLISWVRFEFRLSRRASRVGAHEAREGWPYW